MLEQRDAIRSLQFALQGIITRHELDKSLGLSKDGPFLCFYSDDLYDEMKRLRAMALAANKDGVGLGTIRAEYKDRNKRFDLKQFFYITDHGREYLRLRGEFSQDE